MLKLKTNQKYVIIMINSTCKKMAFACFFINMLLLTSLLGCESKSAEKRTSTAIVKKMELKKALYFSGTIKPVSIINIVSPADGNIIEKYFEYGHPVKAGQPLVKLSSYKLEEDYQSTLVNYLKAKSIYLSSKKKFSNSQELMKYQLISREYFDSEKQQLLSARLDYLQAKHKLHETMKEKASFSEKLSLENLDETINFLRLPHSEHIVYATGSGIALTLPSTEDADAQENKNIQAGNQIKKGEVLLSIGDTSGIKITIQVPEIDINKIKSGQEAIITGPAFPAFTLKGYIYTVTAQAKNATQATGGLPVFTIEIIVPKLTPEQRKTIYVGMSAKVKIEIPIGSGLAVPISAIFYEDNKPYVRVLKKQQREKQAVKILNNTATEAIVESNLQPGQEVVFENE